jgi:hypothetical protein
MFGGKKEIQTTVQGDKKSRWNEHLCCPVRSWDPTFGGTRSGLGSGRKGLLIASLDRLASDECGKCAFFLGQEVEMRAARI